MQGRDLIRTFEAPVRESPPGYRTSFCGRCGSPVPDRDSDSPWLEIAAGTLDNDPEVRPEWHIFVDFKAPWFAITDSSPQLDKVALRLLRR